MAGKLDKIDWRFQGVAYYGYRGRSNDGSILDLAFEQRGQDTNPMCGECGHTFAAHTQARAYNGAHMMDFCGACERARNDNPSRAQHLFR